MVDMGFDGADPLDASRDEIDANGESYDEPSERSHFRNHPNSTRLTNAPSFRWRPLRVTGMPISRDNLPWAALRPKKRRHEKPPWFTA